MILVIQSLPVYLSIRKKIFLLTVVPAALFYNLLFVLLQAYDFNREQSYLEHNLEIATTQVVHQINTDFSLARQQGEKVSQQLQILASEPGISSAEQPSATLAEQALNILSDQQALQSGTAIIIPQADHSLQWITSSSEAGLWPPMSVDYRQDLQQWLGTGIRQGHHSGIYPLPLMQPGQLSGEQGFFYARYTTIDHHRVAVLSFVSMVDFLRERAVLMGMNAYLFLLDSDREPLFELDSLQIPADIRQQYVDASHCLLRSNSNSNSCNSNGGMFNASTFLHIHQPLGEGGLGLSLLLSTSGIHGLLPKIITFIVVQLLAAMLIWLLAGQLSKLFSSIGQSLESIASGESSIADPLASQHDPFHIRQFIARITHRLQQREEQQWAERVSSFDRLLGKLGQGIYYFTHDRDGYMTHLSPWMRTAAGMTDPIETYHYSWLYSDAPGNQQILEETRRVLDNAETSVYELETCDENGNRFHFEIIKKPIYDTRGHIIGAEGVGRNITRWVTDATHFRELLQFAPDAMVITNCRGVIVMVNARAELLTGYQGNMVLGKQLCTLIADEHHNQLLAGEKLSAAPTSQSEVEINIVTRSGELVPVELTMNAIETPDGLHYSMLMRDIRKRRAAEKALYASEQRLRRTIDALQHEYIFYSQDLDCSFTNVTSSVQTILGYSPEYFMAHWRQSLHRNSDRTMAEKVFKILSQGGSHPSYQLEIVKADGTIATLEIYESAAMNDQGEVVAIQGLAHDRTRERRAASALADARDKAQAANDAKTQFLSNMSHELRTPLNGILGYAQLLMTQPNITPEQQDQLQGIQASGQHLLTLINDILDLSKAESGHLMIVARPFNLMELIDSIHRMVAQQAKAKKLNFKVTVGREVPAFLIGDVTKIQQILINLLSNAIKFTDAGSVSLEVSRQQQLIFAVQDSGSGIAGDQLQAIFSPFRQGTSGLKRGGTGLGLAISQRITAAMHGTLSVSSELNVGSRFLLTLPLASATEPVDWSGPAGLSLPLAEEDGRIESPVRPGLPVAQAEILECQLTAFIEIGDIEAIRHAVAHLYDHEFAHCHDTQLWLEQLMKYCDELDIDALSKLVANLSGQVE